MSAVCESEDGRSVIRRERAQQYERWQRHVDSALREIETARSQGLETFDLHIDLNQYNRHWLAEKIFAEGYPTEVLTEHSAPNGRALTWPISYAIRIRGVQG